MREEWVTLIVSLEDDTSPDHSGFDWQNHVSFSTDKKGLR